MLFLLFHYNIVSTILTERDAKAIFFHPFIINNSMKSEAQTINKPSQVYKKSNNEVMRSYPDSYYQEIIEFVTNSRYYL